MNEFIVYIEEFDEFLTTKQISDNPDLELIWDCETDNITLKGYNPGDGWTPEQGEFNNESWEDMAFKAFDYIGKDDIDGNKIYADSSIFEFDFLGFGETEGITYKGFAKWNKQRFRYDIEVLSHGDRNGDNYILDLGKCIDRVSSLKIIDTIQESKLGLIK